ncbi:MAG: hypothetical protein DCO96_11955 [Fluviicola sp. XM-24bin1]|nr:MAG: hypothetical protein DCO96_11955 [Fluviicola sp. XM-24bin1]
MKKLMRSLFAVAFLLGGLTLTSSFTSTDNDGESGRIKLYIVNKCSQDVDFRVESPGSATKYTAYDNSKKPMTFMEGTKIYNSDGEMVHKVTPSSEGDEVLVCGG